MTAPTDRGDAVNTRALRTRARWKKIRAATLVFILFRRRVHHGGGKQPSTKQAKRMNTSVMLPQHQSMRNPVASGAVLLSFKASATPAATSAAATASAASYWFAKKLAMFERLIHKSIQNRTDVDIKLLGEMIRHTKFFHGLTSASIDALAQKLLFRTCFEGEVLHRQGSYIYDTSARSLVVSGSLLVYKNAQYAARAREGEDYNQWYVANTPGASESQIKYGDCVDTCTAGDSCGDDAVLGYLFREFTVIAQVKTVIAYVTQADYKRVIRFNIENETHVLDAVREILTPAKPTKQDLRQPKPKNASPTRQAGTAELSPQQIRVLMRFLGRFKCFRVLPYQFCLEIIHKLQLVTVRSDELVCSASDDKIAMVMVLDGKLCVHVSDSHENRSLCVLHDLRVEDTHRRHKSPQHLEPTECLPGCEPSIEVESAIGCQTVHLCSLTNGDSFGELTISDLEAHVQGASVYHPGSTNGQPNTSTFVRLYRDDYDDVLRRYRDSAEFDFDTTQSILARSLPQDRTDEQVEYVKTFLLTRSSAKLFFCQFPPRILDTLLLHASLERHEIGEEVETFIQKESDPVESMRVVLNGYVGVFKAHANVQAKPVDSAQVAVVPRRAVLRRFHSRLIRANTQMLDTSSGKASPRRASIVKSYLPVPKPVLFELGQEAQGDVTTVDPVSVLPSGAAFGQLQILTGQTRCPYSYAAFAAGPATTDNVTVPSLSAAVCLLCVPSRIVLLHLSKLDEKIVYNPVRMYKRLQHASASLMREGGFKTPLVRGLHFARLLRHNQVFKGIPFNLATTMIEDMSIVQAEPRRIVYERGEESKGVLYVVLGGSARVFKYGGRIKHRRGSSHPIGEDKRPKLSRRISQGPSQSKLVDCEGVEVESEWYSFDKPAGDSIFLSDYSQTVELGQGDGFGRHSFVGMRETTTRRPSASTPSSPRRSSNTGAIGHGTYTESVVSMTEALVGVVTRRHPRCELTADERTHLIRMIEERDDTIYDYDKPLPHGDDSHSPFTPSFNSLASSFRVLEAMGIAHRLTTPQRVQVAHCLKYWKISPGEIVFKQDEAGEAIYYVMFGSVTLFTSSNHDASDSKPRSMLSSDVGQAFLEVREGEVFGDEVFDNMHGDRRLCTAVASSSKGDSKTEVIYLSRFDYECIVNDTATVLTQPARQSGSKDEAALRLLGLGRRSISAKERWKIAIYQVIQLRSQRSQWCAVLNQARAHRIDLVVDVVKHLPVFEDVPSWVIKQFCGNAVLQTFAQDTIVFNKSDSIVDVCFLVVHGAVMLHQLHSPILATNTTSTSTGNVHSQQIDSAAVRVNVQTINAGEIFGEFEILEDHPRRHINAVVCQPGTKLIIIQQEDFLTLWPRRERLEHKLSVLKAQLRKLCRLDPDQVCALYYAMEEKVFRRNEVVSGSKDQSGFLHVVHDGMCVVHDTVVLQKKRAISNNGKSESSTKISLDTRVSTLGPGTILFTEKQEKPATTRRDSHRGIEMVEAIVSPESPKPTQYVVADSPAVKTYGVQLFPRKLIASLRVPQELFVVLLLGKSGLQVIRETVDLQLKWRSDNVKQTGRLVASSLSQASDPATESGKSQAEVASPPRPRLNKPTAPQDVARVLIRRELTSLPERPAESPRSQFLYSPRFTMSSSPASLKPMGTLGSFGAVSHSPRTLSPRTTRPPSPPVLPSLAAISALAMPPSQPSPQSPRHDAQPAHAFDAAAQLRREQQVLVSLPKPAPHQETMNTLQQQQMRQRHGRPPPKRIKNKSKFIDEHAFSSILGLRDDHERKKHGLFKRLQHVKGTKSSL